MEDEAHDGEDGHDDAVEQEGERGIGRALQERSEKFDDKWHRRDADVVAGEQEGEIFGGFLVVRGEIGRFVVENRLDQPVADAHQKDTNNITRVGVDKGDGNQADGGEHHSRLESPHARKLNRFREAEAGDGGREVEHGGGDPDLRGVEPVGVHGERQIVGNGHGGIGDEEVDEHGSPHHAPGLPTLKMERLRGGGRGGDGCGGAVAVDE